MREGKRIIKKKRARDRYRKNERKKERETSGKARACASRSTHETALTSAEASS